MFGAKQQTVLQKKLGEMRREAEERDAYRTAQKLGIGYIDLKTVPVSIDALKLIPEEDARKAGAAALEVSAQGGSLPAGGRGASGGKRNVVAVATYAPQSPELEAVIKKLKSSGYDARIFVASRSAVEKIFESYSFVPKESKEITGKVEISPERIAELAKELKTLRSVQEEIKNIDFAQASTTSILEIILAGGLSVGASDIHLEAEEEKARIRFRMDGILHDVSANFPLKNYEHIVSRIKLISNLKLNVRDKPQDGRFAIGLGRKEVEVRVSTAPSDFGETIVMRLLDPETAAVGLKELGLREDDLEIAERNIKMPNGLILNTGPTGSGKTTTLYAFIKEISNPGLKIITIEDPIEYRLEGVEQTQVEPESGYTFADGLRSIMRQDPDIILVGEVRDRDTADIALQASLTGHLVFSTLHTNDAIGTVPRLVDLGVRPATIGPALTLAIAQRLVRRLCANCKKETKLDEKLKSKIKAFIDKLPSRVDKKHYKTDYIYEPVGCDKCSGIGYKGRVGIFEFLESKSEFEEAILKDSTRLTLKELAKKQGMVTMQEDGVLKVLEGRTSFEEVESATGPIKWQ